MIEGVRVRRLETHRDVRGTLTEILRSDWPEFTRFGQAILTVNLPGIVRGWHAHQRQTDVIVVVSGRLLVGLYDARRGSATLNVVDRYLVGGDDHVAIFVPPGVFHAYQTRGAAPALIANFPDRLYDPVAPDEERLPFDTPQIPFDWDRRD